MRTKTLLLTAALSAAGFASALAQAPSIFSVNAVGYVNVALPAGHTILANPLDGTNNHLNTILPLPDTADNTTILRFNPANQMYFSLQFIAGFGWFSSGPDSDYIINPGEGFWIVPSGPTPLNVTFVGQVRQTGQGPMSVDITGLGNYQLAGSIVPQALSIGQVGHTNDVRTLEFPAGDNDTLLLFGPGVGPYTSWQYIDGYGWFNQDDPNTNGPVIPVGSGFWTIKAGATASWTRNFSVN